MLSLLATLTIAMAQDPTVTVQGTTITGTVHVDVAPEVLRAKLSDPSWVGAVSGSRTTARILTADGPCHRVAYHSPHAIMDADYVLRRCPTDDGWHATLVESNVFTTYWARWRATPDGPGTRLTYEVDLTTSLWFPNSLVRGQTRASVNKMLKAMGAWRVTTPE